MNNNNSPRNLKHITIFYPLIFFAFLIGFIGFGFVFSWIFFENVPVSVHGKGIIVSSSGLYILEAPISGNIQSLIDNIGDVVSDKQKLAEIRYNGEIESIHSVSYSRILDVLFRNHEFVKEGEPLFWMEKLKSLDDREVKIFGFFSLVEGKRIEPGMRATIKVFNIHDNSEFEITGTVSTVSKYAISLENLNNKIPSKELIEQLSQQFFALISVGITPDSQYENLDYVKMFSKQIASIEVEISKVKPIYYIFPMDQKPSARHENERRQ